MDVVVVHEAVTRLHEHRLGVPHELRRFAERPRIVDEERLHVEGAEHPLHVDLLRRDELLHQSPLARQIE